MSPDNTVTAGPARVTTDQRLHQIADLVSEYAELADRTGNADLTALVFQLQLVLADDHAEPIHSRPAPTGSVQFLPPDP